MSKQIETFIEELEEELNLQKKQHDSDFKARLARGVAVAISPFRLKSRRYTAWRLSVIDYIEMKYPSKKIEKLIELLNRDSVSEEDVEKIEGQLMHLLTIPDNEAPAEKSEARPNMELQNEEWKETWNRDYLRVIDAFANTPGGGKLIIGKRDNGEIVGISNAKWLMEELPNLVKGQMGFHPSIDAKEENGKTYVIITVEEQEQAVSLGGSFYKRFGHKTAKLEGQELEQFLRRNGKLKRFAIAVSYAREHEDSVGYIAEKLSETYGEDCILYDKFHSAEFARPNLDTHLQKLYREDSDLIVVFMCAEYNEKQWCGLEWKAIRDFSRQGDNNNRVMLVTCDGILIDNVYGTTDGYLDLTKVSKDEVANLIMKRHKML